LKWVSLLSCPPPLPPIGRERKNYSTSGASWSNLGCKLCKILKYCSLNKHIGFRAFDRAAVLNRSVFSVSFNGCSTASVQYFSVLRNSSNYIVDF